MARNEYDPREEYLGNGLLSAYTFNFKIEDVDQLLVIEVDDAGVETQRVRGSDVTYISSVTFDSVAGGGTVNLLAVLTDQYRLIFLLANDSPTQPARFTDKFSFKLAFVEAAFDRVVGQIQRLAYLAGRSIKISDLDDPNDFDPTLPPGITTTSAAGLIPSINAAGTGWNPISLWTNVTDLLAAITAAAAAATSAATSATSAAASAAAAAASAASSGSGSASATAAAASATLAATYAGYAASDAGDASISEGNALVYATEAGVSAAAAATSASNASANQSSCTTSATAASTSASNASGSATAAAASATAAAASAVAAAASAASVATPLVVGSHAAPYACVAGTTIPLAGTAFFNKKYIKGTGGVTMTASPQIAAGTFDGQQLRLVGTSDTDTVTIANGTGLSIGNTWVAENNRTLDLDWDNGQSLWVETARS